MTDQEIAETLERMIRADAKRPAREQIQDLIDAGVSDEQGRVLIGHANKGRQDQTAGAANPSGGPPAQKAG